MKRLFICILILSVSVSLCACAYFSDRPAPGELNIRWNEDGAMGRAVLQEGYITVDKSDVRTEPGENGKPAGKLQKGDYVRIFEVQDGWGRTDSGWIQLDQLGTYEEAGLKPKADIAQQPQREDEEETNAEDETDGEDAVSSDDPTELYGDWYKLDDEGGDFGITLFTFSKTGYGEEYWVTYPPDFEVAYPQGAFSYTCSYDGNTVNAVGDYLENYEKHSFTFKVNKNTLTIAGNKYYRGDLDTALAKLKKDYSDKVSKLIGSWYRIIEPDEKGRAIIWVNRFDKQGNMYENSYILYMSEIESWKTTWDRHFADIGATDYYVCDNRIYCEWEGYDPDPKSYKISGSKLTWGGYTYYNGDGADAAAKAYETYAPKEEPTVPPTEATAAPTEAPAA